MANINDEEFDDDSEDDEEYVPNEAEIESDDENFDEEDEEEDQPHPSLANGTSKQITANGKKKKKNPKKRSRGSFLHDNEKPPDDDKDEDEEEDDKKSAPPATAEEEKKKLDSLWKDFLSDDIVSPGGKKTPQKESLDKSPSSSSTPCTTSNVTPKNKPDKLTVTEFFDFAGETVKVVKEIDLSKESPESKEAWLKKKAQTNDDEKESSPSKSFLSPAATGSNKRTSGIGSLLGQLSGKKSRLSTLEKSKLDWNRFKEEEGIEEDLKTHNKGKGGYLEKIDFFQRADLRQFEVEKSLRQGSRASKS